MGLFRRDKTSDRLNQLETFVESEWRPAQQENAQASATAESVT